MRPFLDDKGDKVFIYESKHLKNFNYRFGFLIDGEKVISKKYEISLNKKMQKTNSILLTDGTETIADAQLEL